MTSKTQAQCDSILKVCRWMKAANVPVDYFRSTKDRTVSWIKLRGTRKGWEDFVVSVGDKGEIFVDYGELEDSYIWEGKRQFMRIVSEHRKYASRRVKKPKPIQVRYGGGRK